MFSSTGTSFGKIGAVFRKGKPLWPQKIFSALLVRQPCGLPESAGQLGHQAGKFRVLFEGWHACDGASDVASIFYSAYQTRVPALGVT